VKLLASSVILLALWVGLAWPPPGAPPAAWAQVLGSGLLAALGVSVIMRNRDPLESPRWIDPRRWGWGCLALAVLVYYVVKANLDVAYRVLHPALPIHPGIVRVQTRLTSPAARTALANAITLTPGTLTVALTPDGVLYVHCIDVKSQDTEVTTRLVAGRFEPLIRRVFE
jgi:multicomponent Na+:H+ antiporter subunit E